MAGHVLDERFEKYSFGTIRSYRKIISELQLFKVIFTCIPDKFKEDPWTLKAGSQGGFHKNLRARL